MSAKSKTLKKKIASLSALGAGALVAGAGSAEAGVIYSGAINAHVGFNAGGQSSFNVVLPGGSLNSANSFRFSTFRIASQIFATFSNSYRVGGGTRAIIGRGVGYLGLAVGGPFTSLAVFNQGAFWNSAVSTSSRFAPVGRRSWTYYSRLNASAGPPVWQRTYTYFSHYGHSPFSNKFALFRFYDTNSGHDNYGWIRLSYSFTDGFGENPALGPDLTIVDYAWDDSGAQLPAGYAPEPGTLGSTGLAALALGAAGLRKWRKARAQA